MLAYQRLSLAVVVAVAVSACPKSTPPTTPPRTTTPPPPPPLPVPDACDALEPAAVPILPRTSNDEFRQLASDLLGASSALLDEALFARWTPLAQVRGFDNATEARIDEQTLDEQLKTAADIAALLVRSPDVMAACPAPNDTAPVCTLSPTYDSVAQFSGTQYGDCWVYVDGDDHALAYDDANQRWMDPSDPGLFIWNNGQHPGIGVDVVRRFVAPSDGSVHARGTFFDADAGGGDGIAVQVRVHGAAAFSAVIVNGGAPETFDTSFDVRRGDSVDLVVARNADNAYDSTGVSATIDFAPALPSGGLSWDNCASVVVTRLASRAFRRPLRADELVDLKVVFDETSASATTESLASPFFEGLEATLQAALLSPNVLYKPELVPDGFDASEDSFRRASRLALYFRSSFPDDDLWNAALAGDIDDDALRAQAQRLLDNAPDRFVTNFAGQWLNFRALLGSGSTATPLQTSMRREGHDVFQELLAEGQPPQSLLAPGFTIVDGPLAAHYGLDGVDPAASSPVRVETTERGGLFTQGHMLTAGGGSEFKRVIHRGIYTLNRTLCTSVPELDPATREEIAASFSNIDPTLPLAERMRLHRSSGERCIGCHGMMDPLGLALEHFDTDAKWRDAYADGSLVPDNDFDFFGTSVKNPDELAHFVAGSNEYRHCVVEKLVTFGLHRDPRPEEACAIDALSPAPGDDAGGDGGDGGGDAERSIRDISIDAFLLSLHLTEAR